MCKPDMGRLQLIRLPLFTLSTLYQNSVHTIWYLFFKCWPYSAPVLPSDYKLCEGRYHVRFGRHHIYGAAHGAWHMIGSEIF